MQLTMATDYSIRAILYLAQAGRMAPVSEISEKMMIPAQYLITLSRKLKNHHLIAAHGGKQGGYYLARPATTITLLDIMKATEGTIKCTRCLDNNQFCNYSNAESCPVREVYQELQNMTEQLLDSVTIEDLRKQLLQKKCAPVRSRDSTLRFAEDSERMELYG